MSENLLLKHCCLCPRQCGVNRYEKKGFCGETADVRIARAELHFWEEPCISGKNGSGTVFFSGCCLKCCFCQNYEISAKNKGFVINTQELADTFIMLQDKGAENINLVNPTHFVPQIIDALNLLKNKLKIPVVYNCGGFERPETILLLKDNVKIFIPDLKYYSSELSLKYSSAVNYFKFAISSIKKMQEIAGSPVYDERGIMKNGVIVRHLVLPNHRHDSIKLMEILGKTFNDNEIIISLMSQYTPIYKAFDFKELSRKTSTFEYNSVVKAISKYKFDGFIQEKNSAEISYIPKFYDKKYY